jgi:hypothetical protein
MSYTNCMELKKKLGTITTAITPKDTIQKFA